eukprot:3481403-Amphidinium_carterae.1
MVSKATSVAFANLHQFEPISHQNKQSEAPSRATEFKDKRKWQLLGLSHSKGMQNGFMYELL